MILDPIGCRDECGRHAKDESEAEARAWTRMVIGKGWRCPDCTRELEIVNHTYGECPKLQFDEGF